jgi:hypothetical protein
LSLRYGFAVLLAQGSTCCCEHDAVKRAGHTRRTWLLTAYHPQSSIDAAPSAPRPGVRPYRITSSRCLRVHYAFDSNFSVLDACQMTFTHRRGWYHEIATNSLETKTRTTLGFTRASGSEFEYHTMGICCDLRLECSQSRRVYQPARKHTTSLSGRGKVPMSWSLLLETNSTDET